LRDSKDPEIFQAARTAGAVVMTKDSDFVELLQRLGPPPPVIWLTCGKTPNARLREVLTSGLPNVVTRPNAGENLVELADAP